MYRLHAQFKQPRNQAEGPEFDFQSIEEPLGDHPNAVSARGAARKAIAQQLACSNGAILLTATLMDEKGLVHTFPA